MMRWLRRLVCTHPMYIIVPDNPSWARCVDCKKPKRL